MKKTKNYILSFIIPVIVMIILYISVGVIGGNKNVLTVDLANQYIEFFGALKNILSGTISPFYSFSKTLGGNLFGLITYYLISPFNLLIILFNRIDLPKFVLLINILKVATSGLTSYIFFNKTFKKENTSLAFSITYSLMSYNIVYSQNIMWLDGVIILPLIFLGIDNLIKKKPFLFYITLTISIICNYYIGYMSCIAALIYYAYQSYLKEKRLERKEIIYCIKYILISVLTSSIILIPSIFSLMQGKANGILGEFVPNQRYAMLDLITRFYIGTFKNSDILGSLPNVYISVMMTFLVIHYFFNKNINNKEKHASLILIGITALGFVFSPINTIWHTFKNPVGFPFRNSFIFDFILLIIAYKNIINLKEIDKNFIKKFLLYALLLTLLIDKLLYTKMMYYKIIGTLVLMTIYILYLSKNKNKEISKLVILLITLEMTINGAITVHNIKYQNKDKYETFVKETGEIIDNINQNEHTLFRLEKDYSYSSNDQLLLNYNGISHFSSTYEGKTNEFLGKYLGIFNRFYVTNYYGSTLVTNSLFNIKYLLSKNELNYYKKIDKKHNINTYENIYNLPLGFTVENNIMNIELEKNNPFENQNKILKSMDKNIENVFIKNNYKTELNNLKLDENETKPTYKKINSNEKASIKITLTTENKGILYGYMSCSKYKNVDVLLNGKSIIDITNENGYQCNTLELGNYEQNETLELEFVLLENEIKPEKFLFYTLDIDKFNNAINILKQHDELKIIEQKNNIRTNINVEKQNQILYTSIPYDKGMKILLDGKEIEKIKIFDTFIGLDIPKGNHIIEFQYTPRGFKEGSIMSIIGIGLFTILEIKTKKRHR